MADSSYAGRSDVPVAKSQTEIRKMLNALGSTRFGILEDDAGVQIVFEIDLTAYKLVRPAIGEAKRTQKQRDQAERSGWRALVLLIKAKKVAIEQGITTIEREFMADTLLPGGSTLIEHREQIIGHAYEGGPPRLGFDG